MSQNLLQWSVADVASYFSAAGFPEQAVAFKTQVSATALLPHRGRYSKDAPAPMKRHISRMKLFICVHFKTRGAIWYIQTLPKAELSVLSESHEFLRHRHMTKAV